MATPLCPCVCPYPVAAQPAVQPPAAGGPQGAALCPCPPAGGSGG